MAEVWITHTKDFWLLKGYIDGYDREKEKENEEKTKALAFDIIRQAKE